MVLVTYSDSECDSDLDSPLTETTSPQNPQSKPKPPTHLGKRKSEHLSPPPKPRPPPLPSTLHSLYATSARTSTTDDPTLHGGRKRQVTHVAGNWPTHVFLEWFPNRAQLNHLDGLITRVENTFWSGGDDPNSKVTFHRFLRTPLGAQLPLHVSLSAPLVLSTSTKDAFLARLVDMVQSAKVGEISVKFRALDLVSNFEGSRWFVILRLEEIGRDDDGGGLVKKGKMVHLLEICNHVCQDFGLSQLYQRGSGVGVDTKRALNTVKDGDETTQDSLSDHAGLKINDVADAFHISIAWTLEKPPQEIVRSVQNVELGELAKEVIVFDLVKAKIGNVVEDILL